MKTNDLMNANLPTIKKMITELSNDSFTSHEFIQAFAKKFEPQYVSLLQLYNKTPHRIVHSQIALYLLRNKSYLGIEKNGKVTSKTVFGFKNPNELWYKIR